MVPAVLAELDGTIDPADIAILVATGTRRANTGPELRSMLGNEVVDSVRVVNHNARDQASLTWMGTFGPESLCGSTPRGQRRCEDHHRFCRAALLRRQENNNSL